MGGTPISPFQGLRQNWGIILTQAVDLGFVISPLWGSGGGCGMGNTYFALSGLGAKLADNLRPGLWPGLRYFAPLGLNQRPCVPESKALWGLKYWQVSPRPASTWTYNRLTVVVAGVWQRREMAAG